MSRPQKADVVTIGESMVLFQPSPEGTIPYAPQFTSSIGGAESNLAFALSRLGKKVRWISALGTDPFGDLIMTRLMGEGVDVSQVIRDEAAPTAVFFKESKGYGDPNVYYYRRGSAASRLSPEHIRNEWFDGARHLHVTGITPALGESTAEMVKQAMKQAKEQGLTVSLDPNIRRKLWEEEEAREVILSLIPLCDLFLPGEEEAAFLLGEKNSWSDYAKEFQDMGPSIVVMKRGEDGASVKYGENTREEAGFPVKYVVDTVGAGDAFAAGILSVLLEEEQPFQLSSLEKSVPKAMRRAVVMGALATQFKGDWEGSPTLAELESFSGESQHITR
ncbi:sugar kinase [Alkalicoccus daliensis]|uniref:2-dehydro-3-deoxygluconokinase n=1 Tax=Alkalicoccus daliensis TaxID=745820 RepID=A0A1H0F0A5_9BACI|nr:sugar kinase [Alkalicoccus daliensis]SDN87979.1 2-dehydro-3-deoxygluconokinase [Alkalicoccus daliensis]